MKINRYLIFIVTFIFVISCGDSGDGKVSKGHRDAIHIECKNDPDKKLCGLEVRRKFVEEGNEFVILDELNKDQKKELK